MAATDDSTKTKKPVSTWMLHCPKTMTSVGKYNSVSHRNAALKAATKGFTTIWLRPTNTKKIYVYEGSVTPVEPKMISRGDRMIPYSKKPSAKFVESFEYTGDEQLDKENVDPETKPKPRKRSSRADPQVEETPTPPRASETEEEPKPAPVSQAEKPKRTRKKAAEKTVS